ncbi:hypothetical protein AWN90_18985 [Nocardia terpenica]|uniref:Rv3651-like N-terminal domain-containing protein n=2 Tax=Nocardia terpenica TaxID=455432 RepID=A0A164PEM4_9NOCA|nr:hypothetical protein AWN90_18985 [Nocardia terpenica]NQE85935.1 DUF5593 domain-containing protein [Nocardia terpenica]
MVETLDPAAEPTVVSGGEGEKDFVVLKRLIERTINTAKLGASVTADEIYGHIIEARDRRASVEAVFGHRGRRYVLLARPVFGPQQRVHGVQYWLGPVDEDPPEPRHATGVVWDLPARVVHLTVECTRMAGIPDSKFVPALPLAMFWHNANRFDHHEEVYNLLYRPRAQVRLRTTGTVRNLTHHRDMYWQATIRARNDAETVGAWGLLEDLTFATSRPPKATLEQTAFREYLRAEKTYLGVIHVPDGSVVRWLTDPPPWIDCTRAPDQVFPPEDRARLASAVAPDEGVVRAINHTNGYTPTRIILLPYHGRRNGPFAIGRFLQADTHTEYLPDRSSRLAQPDYPEQPK